MKYEIDSIFYNVVIIKKNNKNTYLRIDDNLNIVVTTNYFTTKRSIKNILDSNINSIRKLIEKKSNNIKKNNDFYYLGNKYNIVYDIRYSEVYIYFDNIYAPDEKTFLKWYKLEMENLFLKRLEYNYNLVEESIPKPSLRIRKMKTRWGVCNVKTHTITLNSELMRYNTEKLDYVIIHELSHLVYFNHSKDFWNLVSKYVPNYKKIRKELKE